jgi:hypothetical protein
MFIAPGYAVKLSQGFGARQGLEVKKPSSFSWRSWRPGSQFSSPL